MIKDFWNKLSSTEKAMIGFTVLLLIMVALNWNRVSEGLEKGIKPYNDTHKTELKDE